MKMIVIQPHAVFSIQQRKCHQRRQGRGSDSCSINEAAQALAKVRSIVRFIILREGAVQATAYAPSPGCVDVKWLR
jgi:hypothetical protein